MEADGSSTVDVAIVGAGIAGCSAAKFIREDLGSETTLTVFEKASTIGGRIRDVDVAGTTFEAGGKLIHSHNQYLDGFVDEYGFETRDANEFDDRQTGIWDGTSFEFSTARQSWKTKLGLLKRYGLSVLRARRVVDAVNTTFQEVYEHSDTPYRTPHELLAAIGLEDVAEQSGYDYFAAHNIGSRFVREYVNGATRTFYGQDASMNAVACLTSLAGLGTVGSIYTLEASNVELCRALLSDAGVDLRTSTPVQRVTVQQDQDDSIVVRTSTGRQTFDAVCLAAPLSISDVVLDGIDPMPESGGDDFVELSVSFVEGKLDPTYFGVTEPHSVPGLVVTEATEETDFVHVLNREGSVPADRSLYKLTSRGEAPDSLLDSMFETVDDVTEITWDAFPQLGPRVEFPPFKFAPGLYYVNAMESVVSTMETEVIGSRNVANLVSAEISG